jgi:hypothetical protein
MISSPSAGHSLTFVLIIVLSAVVAIAYSVLRHAPTTWPRWAITLARECLALSGMLAIVSIVVAVVILILS